MCITCVYQVDYLPGPWGCTGWCILSAHLDHHRCLLPHCCPRTRRRSWFLPVSAENTEGCVSVSLSTSSRRELKYLKPCHRLQTTSLLFCWILSSQCHTNIFCLYVAEITKWHMHTLHIHLAMRDLNTPLSQQKEKGLQMSVCCGELRLWSFCTYVCAFMCPEKIVYSNMPGNIWTFLSACIPSVSQNVLPVTTLLNVKCV